MAGSSFATGRGSALGAPDGFEALGVAQGAQALAGSNLQKRPGTATGAFFRAISPLRLLCLVTGAYIAAALLFLLLVGGDLAHAIECGVSAFTIFLGVVKRMIPLWLLPSVAIVIGAVVLYVPALRQRARERWPEVVLSILLSAAFINFFSLVKAHLPAVMPYWADPMFTRIDVALGLQGSFAWLSGVSTLLLLKIYMNGWIFMASFLPAILAAFDADAARRRRFILLWAACWVVLGNLLAGAFMSVGPIFLDRMEGGDAAAFPALFALLQRPDAAELLVFRDYLWDTYSSGDFSIGAGVSAFPSVHVGMAAVIAFYFRERFCEAERRARLSRHGRSALRALAWAVPGLIVMLFLVLSVHLGWHYLSDGVASVLVIWALHALLLKRLA